MISRTLLPRLASPEPVHHDLSVTARYVANESITGGSQYLIDLPSPKEWSVAFDETRRPYGSGELIYPTSSYDWTKLDPTNHATLTRVRLEVAYEFPGRAELFADQLATLIVTEIDHDDERAETRLTLASDEVLLDWDQASPTAEYQVTAQSGNIGEIFAAAQAAAGALYTLPIDTRSAIPSEYRDAVYALELAPGDSFADWAWTLANAAGLWLHSNQEPSSNGGLICEDRPPARIYGLDLRTDAPFQVVTQRRLIRSTEDAASDLDLTVRWTEEGKDQELTRRYTAPNASVRRVASRELRQRPPLINGIRVLPADWPPALNLLNRLAQRTWTAQFRARSCYWLRPRDSVLTDSGPGVIASISFDGTSGLMNLNARPY